MRKGLLCLVLAIVSVISASAQDASTGALRGLVSDGTGARIDSARVSVTNRENGVAHYTTSAEDGSFVVQLLTPGQYNVLIEAPGMSAVTREAVQVEIGGVVELDIRMAIAGARETVSISGDTPMVETQPSTVSNVITEKEVSDLPLNGRRFSDLALLTPGVAQDPRGLTSASTGDLAFGGIRGFQTSFLVDGTDNNNGFFAQARGRYRSPYQFSTEVVQEFRVSSNTFGAELGRSGGAVINVVTKSGSNRIKGSAFYYLRDSLFNAQHAYTDSKPQDRQHQFGFTIGGPLKKNKLFLFGGFDQHVFHVPTVVRFLNGTTSVAPGPDDFEATDETLVNAAAQQLSKMGGQYQSSLLGNAAITKLDWNASPRQYFSLRLNTSRFYGENNVYFDPASPITNSAISENGRENVATESLSASLTSGWSLPPYQPATRAVFA